jgi:hypothetical protein
MGDFSKVLFDAASTIMWEPDIIASISDRRVFYTSTRASALLGYSLEELEIAYLPNIVDMSRSEVSRIFSQLMLGKKAVTVSAITKSGKRINADLAVGQFDFKGVKYLAARII